jgi:hypothetical protein
MSSSESIVSPTPPSSSFHLPRKMTAGMRKERDRPAAAFATTPSAAIPAAAADATRAPAPRRIDSYFHPSFSLPTTGEDDCDSEDDKLPVSSLLSRPTQSSPPTQQSAPSPLPSPSSPALVVRRAMTNITNVGVRTPAQPGDIPSTSSRKSASLLPGNQRQTLRDRPRSYHQQAYRVRQRSYYLQIRAQLAHPDDNTMCAYCGVREHTALHHEDDLKRAGTGVSVHHPPINTHNSSQTRLTSFLSMSCPADP